jgi:hypothetical protein
MKLWNFQKKTVNFSGMERDKSILNYRRELNAGIRGSY